MKKKLNGWIVIGLCFAGMLAAIGIIWLIGQMGEPMIVG